MVLLHRVVEDLGRLSVAGSSHNPAQGKDTGVDQMHLQDQGRVEVHMEVAGDLGGDMDNSNTEKLTEIVSIDLHSDYIVLLK